MRPGVLDRRRLVFVRVAWSTDAKDLPAQRAQDQEDLVEVLRRELDAVFAGVLGDEPELAPLWIGEVDRDTQRLERFNVRLRQQRDGARLRR